MCDHSRQLLDELSLIFALEALLLRIVTVDELLLQEVIVALLARANVRFCVRKQVVRTKREQVEFANLKQRTRLRSNMVR